MKKILIACEESQEVCRAFRELGHEAYSCDLQDCSGGHPEWHFKGDIFEVYKSSGWNWSMVISFPPCTDIANSGSNSFEKKRNNGDQEKSIRFFYEVWKISNCTENPIGIINGGNYIKKYYPSLYEEMVHFGFPFKPTQIVQPYFFGDAYKKSTCLWLKKIPPLRETNKVEPVYIEYNSKKNKSGKSKYSHFGRLGKGKGKERSKTPAGLAKAMAEQWGAIL